MPSPSEPISTDLKADMIDPPGEESVEEVRPKSYFGLSNGDQIFVAILLVVLLLLSGGYWLKLSGWGSQPVEIERLAARKYDFRLDVNDSTWVEWAQLEGIGEVLARKIIADRQERGPFVSVDDVRRVNGIGEKKLAVLREWLYVGEVEADHEDSAR